MFIPSTNALDVKKVGKAVLDYQASGIVEVFGHLDELEINISALPQIGKCEYNAGKIIEDEFGNLILNQKYRDVSSDVKWWIKCEIYSEKSFAKLISLSKFPKLEYEEAIETYLKFTNLTQPSEKVKLKANEIVEGSSTNLEASLRLAEWTANNMEYDIKYAQELRPASWIVENLKGVCSEYSHLLISFLRFLNIPSRYSAGYVYSFEYEDFQPHSWVEAYLNEWVPLDPTFNEFGNIDALHIKLRHSLDGDEPSIKIKYSSVSDVVVRIKEPETEISIVSVENETEFLVVNFELNKNLFGENDYALLTISVENPTRYYIPTSLLINKPNDLELIYGLETNAISLKPRSTGHFYFIFRTPSNLEENYVYTYPVIISVLGAKKERINIKVDPGYKQKSLLEDLLLSIKKEEIEKKHKIKLQEIKITPEIVYETNPNITISLKNIGNIAIPNLILNIKYDDIDLNYTMGRILINEEKNVTINLPLPTREGEVSLMLSLIAEDILTSFKKTFVYAKTPEVKMSYVGPNEIIDFESLNFELEINIIGNVSKVKLTTKTLRTSFEEDIHAETAKFNYSLPADSLEVGKNEIVFSIEVVDIYGQKFIFTEAKTVERKVSNLLVRLIILIKKLLQLFSINFS